MNFLMRPSHTAHVDERPVHEISKGAQHSTKPSSTLEGLIAEESFSNYGVDEVGGENGSVAGLSPKRDSLVQENLSDVTEEEGWITIPYSIPSLFQFLIYVDLSSTMIVQLHKHIVMHGYTVLTNMYLHWSMFLISFSLAYKWAEIYLLY